jgi:hypothetical protein
MPPRSFRLRVFHLTAMKSRHGMKALWLATPRIKVGSHAPTRVTVVLQLTGISTGMAVSIVLTSSWLSGMTHSPAWVITACACSVVSLSCN